jgi:hypothetical protein
VLGNEVGLSLTRSEVLGLVAVECGNKLLEVYYENNLAVLIEIFRRWVSFGINLRHPLEGKDFLCKLVDWWQGKPKG